MSSYGEGDYCDLWRVAFFTAAKAYACRACGEAIAIGDRYHRTSYLYEGGWHTVRRCMRCQVIFEHLSGRILKEGDVEEFCDESLNCGHSYEDRWDESPPEAIAALAFWRPGDPLPVVKAVQCTNEEKAEHP